jgi:hypothetical protein
MLKGAEGGKWGDNFLGLSELLSVSPRLCIHH